MFDVNGTQLNTPESDTKLLMLSCATIVTTLPLLSIKLLMTLPPVAVPPRPVNVTIPPE
jgi:hypothetical protein